MNNSTIQRPVKHLFVGSGPATLAAVLSLPPAERRQTVILEAAHQAPKVCPGIKLSSCTLCEEKLCPVVNNFGGSSAAYGNKLCHLPASDGVMQHAGLDFSTINLPDSLRSIFDELGHRSADIALLRGIDVLSTKKYYRSDRMLMSDYRRFITGLMDDVCRDAKVYGDHLVRGIMKAQDGRFCVKGDFEGTFIAENVILATGRSGHANTIGIFRELGVDFHRLSPDIGFRIEIDSEILNEDFLYQLDPKYKYVFEDLGSGRTFCTCVDGAIIPVRYGDAFFADGAFLKKATGRTNFAVMVRTEDILTPEEIESWCKSITRSNRDTLLVSELVVAPTISASELGIAIRQAVLKGPTPKHSLLFQKMIGELFDGPLSPISMSAVRQRSGSMIKIFGPSIDRYWSEPALSEKFETNIEGLSVIGDAAGLSRGIVQALYSGVAWAAGRHADCRKDPRKSRAAIG